MRPTRLRRDAPAPDSRRDAVYNEQTARTFAAVAAIRESVEATGLGAHVDYFILSDSTQPDAWMAEQQRLSRHASAAGPDAGCITAIGRRTMPARPATSPISFTRWGGHYEHMIVLDADSLMTGTCIVRLAGGHGGRS